MLRGISRLNRYEKRILDIAQKNPRLVQLKQVGLSRQTKNGFQFAIHSLEIGTKSAIKKNPVGLIAGVHGLETIGIRILLDFLEYITDPDSEGFMHEIRKGQVGIVAIPIVNPGGVALKRRSNPAGVDLMRNSGIKADKVVPFFGGQSLSRRLPYYRGIGLEPESRTLHRVLFEKFYKIKNRVLPVLDIHSGFGRKDSIWWPYAKTAAPCADHTMIYNITNFLRLNCHHDNFEYSAQGVVYNAHGDLWDMFYDHYLKYHSSHYKRWNSHLLPLTLELGTWAHLRKNPGRIFNKRNIFNPPREKKAETITGYRSFLRDFVLLAKSSPGDWV